MSATQLSFTLRTSSNVKTAHLLGSWDNYAGQLPLSKDPSKTGAWKGTFRFSSSTLKPGQRYWYYVSPRPLPAPIPMTDELNSTSWMAIMSRTTQLNPPPRNPPPADLSTFSMFQLPNLPLPPPPISAVPSVDPSVNPWRFPRAALCPHPRSSPQSPASPMHRAKSAKPTTAFPQMWTTSPSNLSKPPCTALNTGTSAPPRPLAPAYPAAAPIPTEARLPRSHHSAAAAKAANATATV